MKWKKNARKIPASHMRKKLKEDMKVFHQKRMIMRHGKPWVVWDHTRDACVADDEGVKTIVASQEVKRGEYIFPHTYKHPARGFIGETKDIRYTESGWMVYLDAVLRNKTTGKPVKLASGQTVDMSGWFYESDLVPAESFGKKFIAPGATDPSVNELCEARIARIKRTGHLVCAPEAE